MTKSQFDGMMQEGLTQAKTDASKPVDEVVADLKRKASAWASESDSRRNYRTELDRQCAKTLDSIGYKQK